MLIGTVAGILRFWQLGDLPPGLYRDEAYNGLDAIGVLEGVRPLFFENNNGREPAYIYLTAVAVALFGRTAFAVRISAAVIGTLTTIPVYLLVKAWYGQSTGLFAGWIWATTVWAIHLSRVGFRAVLLIPLLALAAWIATLASTSQPASSRSGWLWVLSGLLYGLSFYTYLAVRLTPLFIIVVTLYAIWKLRFVPWRPLSLFGAGFTVG
ncbi:MAG: glycosyltransferase family 39 protein, partial [Chloroflexota bacterium]